MRYQFDFGWFADYYPVFLKGIWITLELTFVGTVLGVLVGIVCAWARTQGPAWLRPLPLGRMEDVASWMATRRATTIEAVTRQRRWAPRDSDAHTRDGDDPRPLTSS